MGSFLSKIWGSPTTCGIAYPHNCTNCGLLCPECCKTCNPAGDQWKQCFIIIADTLIIMLVSVVAVAISELLLGDEDGLNLFDDVATFAQGMLTKILSVWKGTLGEIDNTLFNLFNGTFKAS